MLPVNSTTCLPALPTEHPGSRYCVRHNDLGVHACPSSLDSPFWEQIIAYTNYVDTRKCTECVCRASEDDACSPNKALTMEGLTSEISLCTNFSMAGTAVGSKELTDLVYKPGSCEAMGGLPVGTAHPDETTAATWCCMPAPTNADADTNAQMP